MIRRKPGVHSVGKTMETGNNRRWKKEGKAVWGINRSNNVDVYCCDCDGASSG
ncbi:hypothetical protein C7212DRAFT_176522 [Tuber magnatum]|uniref:Uncharacterized protein n=1 Tax=Tuber magnatum TaxID=42249 RepID=A0A317SWW1_9PEZI|nr:hypothetical protein C7212DRAFT_176522 [Tuber magnatum]